MTNLEWIRTLSAKELSDLLYDYWLPRGQYVWTDSRKGLVKMLCETYLERDCDKCKHQGNCYCVKGLGCPFDPKTKPSNSEKPNNSTISKMEQVDEPQTEKGGCTNCDGKDLCNNAFTEISQYCGAYEPQNGYQTFNGTSVYVSRLEDEPQTEEHCENCRHKDECEGATYEYKNTEWWCLAYAPIDEPQTEQVGVPFGEMDEATFKSHCLNCQRDTADIKCLDCDGNKYFLPYGSKTDCAWK